MSIKVTRVNNRWHVKCAECCDASVIDIYFRPPWIAASEYADAIWWANWHAREHERLRCQPCGRTSRIEHTVILDSGAVRVGDRLFVRDQWPHTWKEAE